MKVNEMLKKIIFLKREFIILGRHGKKIFVGKLCRMSEAE